MVKQGDSADVLLINDCIDAFGATADSADVQLLDDMEDFGDNFSSNVDDSSDNASSNSSDEGTTSSYSSDEGASSSSEGVHDVHAQDEFSCVCKTDPSGFQSCEYGSLSLDSGRSVSSRLKFGMVI